MLRAGPLLIALLAACGPSAAVAQSQPQCLARYYVLGRSNLPTRDVTESVAMQHWSEMVATRRGTGWSDWSLADDRSMTCVLQTRYGGAQGWTCWARARPCHP